MPTGFPTESVRAAVVLVVEDEPVLRSVVSRGLAMQSFEVYDAATVDEARRLLDVIQPGIVISDLDLPDGSGLDVLAALDVRRMAVPVVFVSAYAGAYRSRLSKRSGVELLEKPVPLDELVRIVRTKLSIPPTLESARFTPAEYLQLACLGGHSTVLELHDGPTSLGQIVVQRGEVWNAKDATGTGAQALQRLLHSGEGGSVRTSAFALHAEPGPRQIFDSWQSLVLEALRVYDELGRGALDFGQPISTAEWRSAMTPDEHEFIVPTVSEPPPAPPPNSEPTGGQGSLAPDVLAAHRISYLPPLGDFSSSPASRGPDAPAPMAPAPAAPPFDPDREFDEEYERGVEALLRRDYPAARDAFLKAGQIKPDDKKVQANLARLKQLGFGSPT